jgi:hypothetical protein
MKSKFKNTGFPIDEEQECGVACIARHLHLITLPLPQSEYRRTSQNVIKFFSKMFKSKNS